MSLKGFCEPDTHNLMQYECLGDMFVQKFIDIF